MSFSNEKLDPSESIVSSMPEILFKKVRSTTNKKARRKRQCFKCQGQIEYGNEYINHEYKYDNKIVTVSFHLDCFNSK